MRTKKCSNCKETKEVKHFVKTPSKSGYASRCRDCMSERKKELRKKRVTEKTCVACKLTKSTKEFNDRARKCKKCNDKDKKIRESKLNNMGDLRETQYRLKNNAKMSLEELKQVEKEKLNNGYTWIDEQREYGKVRVLRKIK